jgi:hypothetical protein
MSPARFLRWHWASTIGAVYAATDGIAELSRTARRQNGVIDRDQCRNIGLHRSYVGNQLDASDGLRGETRCCCFRMPDQVVDS